MRASTQPRAASTRTRRLEVSVDLALDGSLSATDRLILAGLVIDEPGRAVVWPTDKELAERHGVSLKTVQNALSAGVRSGWIVRADGKDFRELYPGLAGQVPQSGRKARRFIVLLWLADGLEPVKSYRQDVAGPRISASTPLPAREPQPVTDCQPLACAPVSACSYELRTSEERTFVPPLSPLPKTVELRDFFARKVAEAATREAEPGYAPPAPHWWETRKKEPPPRTAKMKLEELVAACLGPDAPAAIDALLLYLATELRDDKPQTQAFWSRTIPAILTSADGFGHLVELILAARKKKEPAKWFSVCLSRGQPGAQKPTPGATVESSPGVGQKAPYDAGDPSGYKYTRRVNP